MTPTQQRWQRAQTLKISCWDATDAERRRTCVKMLAEKCHPLHLFIRFGEGDVEAMQRLIDGVA